MGGIGGTLAGNAPSLAAMRATLEHVLTAKAFEKMIPLAVRFNVGVSAEYESTGCRGTCSGWDAARSTRSAKNLRGMAASPRRRETLNWRGCSSVRAESGGAADAVPQYGADVPGDDGGGH